MIETLIKNNKDEIKRLILKKEKYFKFDKYEFFLSYIISDGLGYNIWLSYFSKPRTHIKRIRISELLTLINLYSL